MKDIEQQEREENEKGLKGPKSGAYVIFSLVYSTAPPSSGSIHRRQTSVVLPPWRNRNGKPTTHNTGILQVDLVTHRTWLNSDPHLIIQECYEADKSARHRA